MMERHIINSNATLLEALERLNDLSGGIMTLMAVDADGRMAGTVTDGDVRRGLLSGVRLTDPVEAVMFRLHINLTVGEVDVEALRAYRQAGIRLLPLVNPDGTIHSLIDLDKRRSLLPVSAVLMAGGRGERLRPLTDTLPKPLLPVDGKAIIDYNIENLSRAGITDITVTTRYLADKIAEHFARPVAGVQVKCVEEEQPLGTIGALSLLPQRDPKGVTLVMNSDLLTTINLEEMYLCHTRREADITIAVLPYAVSVPYAILTIDNETDLVTGIEEKPTYSHYANAGIYMISNRLLNALVPGERIDATDLVENTIKEGGRVAHFPINGTWIDVGTPADLRQACELMRHLRNFMNE